MLELLNESCCQLRSITCLRKRGGQAWPEVADGERRQGRVVIGRYSTGAVSEHGCKQRGRGRHGWKNFAERA